MQVDDIAIEAHASPPEGRRRSSRGGKPPRGRAASPDGERGAQRVALGLHSSRCTLYGLAADVCNGWYASKIVRLTVAVVCTR